MILKKINLNYEEAHGYVVSSLEDANLLSDEILKLIDFKKGEFFTLLHRDFILDSVYEFSSYLIFHENYKLSSTEDISGTIRMELTNAILGAVQSDENTYCVFDDFMRDLDEVYEDDPLKGEKYLNNKQTYYILDRENISVDAIEVCMHRSYAFWHSLCLLTHADLKTRDLGLSEATIHDIASQAQLIVVGAYDGDGYVFWQKTGYNYF